MPTKVILSLFDFLGYKNWFTINGKNLMAIIDMLRISNKACLALLDHLRFAHKIQFHNYADNILFWTTDVSESATDHFFLINSFVFNLLMNADRPLRGAISIGEAYFSSNDNIFTGRPLIEAHEFERGQNWLGVTLCDSIELTYSSRFLQRSKYLVRHKVPCKKNTARNRWVLDWPSLLPHIPESYHEHACSLDDLNRLEENAPKDAKEKYFNTRKFYLKRMSQ